MIRNSWREGIGLGFDREWLILQAGKVMIDLPDFQSFYIVTRLELGLCLDLPDLALIVGSFTVTVITVIWAHRFRTDKRCHYFDLA